MEEEIEEQNSEVADEENIEEITVDDSVELTVEDYKKLEEKNKSLFQRAKRAEEEAKKLRQPKETLQTKEVSSGLTREEAILIAKGVSEEVLTEASEYAKFKGITLKAAMEAPLIVALSDKIKQEERRNGALLGASNGSGKNTGGDLSQAVGMTEEEHRKALGFN